MISFQPPKEDNKADEEPIDNEVADRAREDKEDVDGDNTNENEAKDNSTPFLDGQRY